MDDRIRRAVYRPIYSFGPLFKYGNMIVPLIHTIVKNGRVTLEGAVDSEGDKNLAGVRANLAPGIFQVPNNLRVVSSANPLGRNNSRRKRLQSQHSKSRQRSMDLAPMRVYRRFQDYETALDVWSACGPNQRAPGNPHHLDLPGANDVSSHGFRGESSACDSLRTSPTVRRSPPLSTSKLARSAISLRVESGLCRIEPSDL